MGSGSEITTSHSVSSGQALPEASWVILPKSKPSQQATTTSSGQTSNCEEKRRKKGRKNIENKCQEERCS